MIERLGRYDLVQRIGSGGMAECFLAVQRGMMGFEKLVAVKKIHPHLARQETFIEMLLKEARVSALLKHPRIVDIYDLGRAGETYFIAMEFLPGQPLSKVLPAAVRARKPPNVFDAIRVIADAADALDAAHNLRTMSGDPIELIHRDVSPGNIIILYDGSVKLVDFGIAKAHGEETNVGGPRMLKGKCGYVSPEQIEERADRRSDIFSLGICMWEALTMKRLFKAEDDLATLELVKQGKVAPPSSLRSEVPAEIDRICLRCVEVDPDQRYQSARELRVDLENLLWTANYYRASNTLAGYMKELFGTAIAEQERLLRAAQGTPAPAPAPAPTDDDDGAEVQIIEAENSGPVAVPQRALPLPPPRSATAEQPALGKRAGSPPRTPAPTPTPIALETIDDDEPTTNVQDEQPTTVAADPAHAVSPPTPPDPSHASTPPPPTPKPSTPPTPSPSTQGEPTALVHTHAPLAAPMTRRRRRALVALLAGSAALVLIVVVALAASGDSDSDDSATDSGKISRLGSSSGDLPAAVPDPAAPPTDAPAAAPEPGRRNPRPSTEPPPTVTDDPDPALPPDPDPTPSPVRAPTPERPSDRAANQARARELYGKGVRAFVEGRSTEARRTFREAVQLDPGYAPAHRGLGLVYERSGDRKAAIKSLEKYLRLAPGARDAASVRQRIARLKS